MIFYVLLAMGWFCCTKSTIKIANLATGECLHIAKPGKHLKGDPYNFYKFGFHPVTKEYKVLHFLRERVDTYSDKSDVIQVYTLGEDKWRDVRVPEVQSLYDVERSGVVIVDGAMYWLNGKRYSKWGCAVVSFDLIFEQKTARETPAIVSFDLSGECFEWIQLPNNMMILKILLVVVLACTTS
jgi:F-box interacting protein